MPGRVGFVRSVGGAVLLTLVCVNTVLLAALGVVDFFGEKSHLKATLQRDVTVLAEQLAVNLDIPLWNLEQDHLARVVEGAMRDERVAAVVVTDRETGRLALGRARDAGWGVVPMVAPAAPVDAVLAKRTILYGGKPIGAVEVFLTTRFVSRDLERSLLWIALRILCLNAALAAALALVLRRQVIRPLRRLEAYAARVRSGTAAEPVADSGTLRWELRSLGRTMEQMVHRLQTAQDKYRDIFENATEGIFQTTVDGHVLAANAALATMLGYVDPQALVTTGGDVRRQIFSDVEDHQRLVERLVEEGSVAGYQTRFLRRDRQAIWVLVNVRLVRDEGGNSLYTEGTVTDVTARLRAERRLEILNRHLREAVRERTERLAVKASLLEAANRRLQELDRLKSGFLSTVSHDLRTPLTSIMGFAKLIMRDFTKYFLPLTSGHERLERQAARLTANLSIIENEGERLTRLINDFLDLSKIESGRAEWRDAPVDVAAVIRQAVDAVSADYQDKPEVTLSVEVAADLPALRMDRDRLSQILVNLLGNAIKFTDQGSVRLRAGVRDGQFRLEVIDTGQGVASESLEKIFDKFHQAGASDTVTDSRQRKGTGLGLAICRQIVEHYRGRIWVESELGRGSRFIAELPLSGA